MTSAELLETARAQRVVPLFYDPDPDRAAAVVGALARGGARLIEYTLRGPGAERTLAHLVETAPEGIAVAAGSVTSAHTAGLALAAGAAAVVGPNGDAEVAAACHDAGVAYVPGCLTPTEIVAALRWGCMLIKVFPVAALGGPAYVRALRGPLPTVSLMPTGGVAPGDARAYLDAGAVCVGMGSELVRRRWVEAGAMAELAAEMRAELDGA
jgi:2-dehydro-3-deoxyphosphogluconate aldolase / (4S)-4-hydroxy-2-oxoglutarate aldolase